MITNLRRQLFNIIDVNNNEGGWNRFYDFFSAGVLILNIIVSVMNTFDVVSAKYGPQLGTVEGLTVFFFVIDCFFRIWTAKYQYPEETEGRAICKYVFSFYGIIDILSFVPYYLPFFFPAGVATFRLLRMFRIFRLFKLNSYSDSLGIIAQVIKAKGQQLISAVVLILILMLFSSLCMYSLEHDAQPDVFSNAFSGIWWSVSTLLTIGYGDIYPITPLGQVFSIVITFLGVGMVAIPTGIISAGFIEQSSKMKRLDDYGSEQSMYLIKIQIRSSDHWVGKSIKELNLPGGVIVAVIKRGLKTLVPRGDTVIESNDILIIGAESYADEQRILLHEITLAPTNPWVNTKIRDLDISRQTVIVMIRRKDRVIIPTGDMVLLAGDLVVLYTQEKIKDTGRILI